MPKSRADYMREYRAARKTVPADPVCECCHHTFTAERGDARFCSDSCRAAAWRRIMHRAHVHDPAGWQIPANTWTPHADRRQRCSHEDAGVFCQEPATWLTVWVLNEWKGMVSRVWLCDQHAKGIDTLGCDDGAACHDKRNGCPAQEAIERDRRAVRRRAR